MVDGAVRVLGSVAVVMADGREVALPSASQRRLVAILALAGGDVVRAECLAERMGVSSGALRTIVSRVRARIGADAICGTAGGYRLSCGSDADRFVALLRPDASMGEAERLEAALALWHGATVEEFRDEPWAQAAAARLDELRRVAVEDLAEVRISEGHSGSAVAEIAAQVAEQPLRDRSRALLMAALAADGRQTEALRAYEDYRSMLAREFGTEPSGHVRDVERAILTGWSGPRAASGAAGR